MRCLSPELLKIYCFFMVFILACTISCYLEEPFPFAIIDDGSFSDTIAYDSQGNTAPGTPVLFFIHGWCNDRSYWQSQVDAFSTDYHIVTVDLSGHGDSAGVYHENYTMEVFAEDILYVTEQLSLDNIILVGHSMGGVVALETAKALSGKVIGIIGVDVFHNIEEELENPSVIRPLLFILKQDFVNLAPQYLFANFFSATSDVGLKNQIIQDMLTPPPRVDIAINAYDAGYVYAYNGNIISAFDSLQIPMRCILSDIYANDIDAGKQHTNSFEAVIMPDIGHFMMREDPAAFNILLEQMIDDILAF